MFARSIPSNSLLAAALIAACALGCAQTKESEVEDPEKLRQTVASFHRLLRWEKIQSASRAATPGFRNTFLGRYEEYDGDVDILQLRVKNIERRRRGHRLVEVEQRWYVKPDMTVQEDEFVEIWKKTDEGWRLDLRLEKTEWKARTAEETGDSSTDRVSSTAENTEVPEERR